MRMLGISNSDVDGAHQSGHSHLHSHQRWHSDSRPSGPELELQSPESRPSILMPGGKQVGIGDVDMNSYGGLVGGSECRCGRRLDWHPIGTKVTYNSSCITWMAF